MSNNYARLASFRKLLNQFKINAYLLHNTDYHNSEYIVERDARVTYMSGFTGSNSTIVVTDSSALLWTDGRYFDQATKELNNEWTLMKDRSLNVPTVEEWLATEFNTSSDYHIGFDPKLMSIAEYNRCRKNGLNLKSIDSNLIDLTWENDKESPRPKENLGNVFVLPESKTGQSASEKLKIVRCLMLANDVTVLSALDEIAWLLNMRGCDISYNPVFFSFLILTEDYCRLYANESSMPDTVKHYLDTLNVTLLKYDQFWHDLKELKGLKIRLPLYASIAIKNKLVDNCELKFENFSKISKLKAIKNEIEQNGMRLAHIKDAVAICELLYEVSKNPEHFDELSVENRLESLRAKQAEYVYPSFHTISAFGPNASIIHYESNTKSNMRLSRNNLYLLDAGAQFLHGTTDMTRTLHFGTPSKEQKQCFTAVLKGHLALASTKFPEDTSASRLDSIARCHLWDIGKDYKHGTGHGVGCFLNVHEGPFTISPHLSNVEHMHSGVVVSNEPGYYKTGEFGIRIENVLLCKQDKNTPSFLCFENLTFVPIDRILIDIDMMTDVEIDLLNEYHYLVREKLVPELKIQSKPQMLIDWLILNTQSLER
ncbi:hypothetical protein GJ496_005708 [Pomphorhynchus laevis]|nr:hypothetical protein GJ496_005708 [Pomphorhynchus laevis]